jgi:hypothetical protein
MDSQEGTMLEFRILKLCPKTKISKTWNGSLKYVKMIGSNYACNGNLGHWTLDLLPQQKNLLEICIMACKHDIDFMRIGIFILKRKKNVHKFFFNKMGVGSNNHDIIVYTSGAYI